MDVVTTVLGLLLAVVISSFATRLLPFALPRPLLQIVLGAAMAAAGFDAEFESHVFLLLFIPPLLFLDGWRIPKGAFFQHWKTIWALAIGLVVFTVVGLGLFINWLIPAVPLAVSFALAAILSPTDPIAVSSMTAGTPLPSRLMHILEGEALLNDATALVCFNFAVTAALTGIFSPANAALSFVLVAGGGLLVGVAVTTIIGRLSHLLVRRVGEEPSNQILISLLIPFVAYLAAEALHVSGVLAAAAAGITMHYDELVRRQPFTTRMERNVIWSTLQVALNGIIFVILGQQVLHILRTLPEVVASIGASSSWLLVRYMLGIMLVLGMLRFAWVWTGVRVTLLRAARRGENPAMPQTRLLAIMATAGVRGAITLAGVLTLPLLMPDGSPFPARDVVIFLATGVILLSLLIASVALPWLARGLATDVPAEQNVGEASARIAAAEAAIRRLEQVYDVAQSDPAGEARAKAVSQMLDLYQRRLDYGQQGDGADVQGIAEGWRQLRLEALHAERDALYRLRRSRTIDDDVHQRLVRELDLVESSLSVRGRH